MEGEERRAVASSASRQASAWEVAQDEGCDYCSRWLGSPLVEAQPAEELSLREGR